MSSRLRGRILLRSCNEGQSLAGCHECRKETVIGSRWKRMLMANEDAVVSYALIVEISRLIYSFELGI
jgi:hypothetical protein